MHPTLPWLHNLVQHLGRLLGNLPSYSARTACSYRAGRRAGAGLPSPHAIRRTADKAENLAHEHKDQIADGVDKVSDLLKDKLSGHDEQIEKAEGFLKDKLDNL